MAKDIDSTASVTRLSTGNHHHSNAQSLLLLGSLTLIVTLFLRIIFSDDHLGIIFTFLMFGSGLALMIIGFAHLPSSSHSRPPRSKSSTAINRKTSLSQTALPVSKKLFVSLGKSDENSSDSEQTIDV